MGKRLIDARELIERMVREDVSTREKIVAIIDSAPTETFHDRRRWIPEDIPDPRYKGFYKCCCCGKLYYNPLEFRYCPNCGVKMEE